MPWYNPVSWFENAANFRSSSTRPLLNAVDGNSVASPQDRSGQMTALWKMYTNNLFDRNQYGGIRDQLNEMLGSCRVPDLVGMINPAERIVEFYQHIWRGDWGDELKPEEETPEDIAEALKILWADSQMNRRKQMILRLGACMGTVGLRVHVRPEDRKTVLRYIDPRDIHEVVLDDDWNVEYIKLVYARLKGQKVVNYTEELDRNSFKRWEDGTPVITTPNELGETPVVIINHIDNPDDPAFGLSSFHGSVPVIIHATAVVAHLLVQIHRHVRPLWTISGTGEAPERIKTDDTSFLMLNNTGITGDHAPVTIEPLVAPLDFAAAMTVVEKVITELRARQPELVVTDGDAGPRSNTSGELIAQLRQPTSDRLKMARTNYDEGYVKASKIAMRWMQKMGDPKAPKTEMLDWKFECRPALPLTSGERWKELSGEGQAKMNLVRAASEAVQNLGLKVAQKVLESENLDLGDDEIEPPVAKIEPKTDGNSQKQPSSAA